MDAAHLTIQNIQAGSGGAPLHSTPVIHTCGKVCAQYPPSTLCAVHNIHRMYYLPPFAPPPEESSQQKDETGQKFFLLAVIYCPHIKR